MSIITNATNNNLGNGFFYGTVLANSTQVNAMRNTPITYLSSPGTNEIIIIRKFGINLDFNSIAYSGGGTVILKNGTNVITGTIGVTNVTAGSSNCFGGGNAATATITGSIRNQAVLLTNNTASFAAGNSNVNFWCVYSIASFSLNSVTNSVNNIANNGFAKQTIIIPSASVQNLGSTPVSILSSLGAGKAIIPNFISFLMPFNTTPYNAVNLSLVYHGQSTALMTTGATTFMNASADAMINIVSPTFSNYDPANANGLGIDLTASGAAGSGDSPIKVILEYSIVDL